MCYSVCHLNMIQYVEIMLLCQSNRKQVTELATHNYFGCPVYL